MSAESKVVVKLPDRRTYQTLGTFRLLLIELLVCFLETEDKASIGERPIVESIFNSTIQTIVLWLCELQHNTIFTNLVFKFLSIYLRHASDISLCNSLIRTGALQGLADHYT